MTKPTKFRPYFSSEEMLEIITALKERPSAPRLALCRYLDSYLVKIDRGTMQPAYELKGTPREQFKDSLGLEPPAPPKQFTTSEHDLYARWQQNPMNLSPTEIGRVQQYRFLNDMMDGKEEAEYLQYNGVNY